MENKQTKLSYLPPGNVLCCDVVWGDAVVLLGLAVTVSFGHTLGRAALMKNLVTIVFEPWIAPLSWWSDCELEDMKPPHNQIKGVMRFGTGKPRGTTDKQSGAVPQASEVCK